MTLSILHETVEHLKAGRTGLGIPGADSIIGRHPTM